MLEITVKNDQGKTQKVNIVQGWEELSLKQFIEIEGLKDFNPLGVFSILSGIECSVLENSKDTKLEKAVYDAVKFLGHVPNYEEMKASPYIELDGDVLQTPKKIDSLMLGQKMMVMAKIREVEDLIKEVPTILAILFLPQLNGGRFDSNKVEPLAKRFEGANGLRAYSIARGFFLSYKILKKVGVNNLKTYLHQKPRTRRLSPKWLTEKD